MAESAGRAKLLELTFEEVTDASVRVCDQMVERSLRLGRAEDALEISVPLDDAHGALALLVVERHLAGSLEHRVSRRKIGRVGRTVERSQRLKHVLEQGTYAGLGIRLGDLNEHVTEEGQADRERKRSRLGFVGSGTEVGVHAFPPIADTGAELLRLGGEALGADKQSESINRDVIPVAHDDRGGLAALEYGGEQLVVALADLRKIQLGQRVALGVLQGDAGEVEDVGFVQELEERLFGKGGRHLDGHDDLPDQSLEEAELLAGDLHRGRSGLDEDGPTLFTETDGPDFLQGLFAEIVRDVLLDALERIDV